MESAWKLRAAAAALAVVTLAVAAPVVAQETEQVEVGPTKPWTDEAQIAYVDTGGNSSSRTFAVSNRFTYNWTYSELIFTVEMFRASSTTRELTNTDAGVLVELDDKTDAERYELGGKYRMNLLDELFWYANAGWYRNRPAGTDSRTGFGGGLGYRFLESDTTLIAGEAGGLIETENPVGGDSDTHLGLRGFLEARHRFSENARINIGFELLENLQDTSDLRMNSTVAVTSQLTDVFALRVSWDLKYDAEPTQIVIDSNPEAPPGLFTFDKTDRTLSASLVINL